MAKQTINTIKQWFRTSLKPTQQQFWDWLDSFRHKDDKIPAADIEGIDELLLSKADKSVLDTHLIDPNAHGELFAVKADKTYVDAQDAIVLSNANSYTDSRLTSVYIFKGSVDNYASLPNTGLTNGDVYNVLDTGANYAWADTFWDKLGDTGFTEQDVRNTPLTGLTDTTGSLSATDKIIEAFGKIKKSLSDLLDAITKSKTNLSALAHATTQNGLTREDDTVDIIQTSDTTFTIVSVREAAFYDNIGVDPDNVFKTFPTTNHTTSEINILPNDGFFTVFIGKDQNGLIQYSLSSFSQINGIFQIGWLYIKRVTGVNSFLFSGVNPMNFVLKPNMAGNNDLLREMLGISVVGSINPNTNMTLNNSTITVKGESVNFIPGVSGFNNRRVRAASALTQFIRVNPGIILSPVEPTIETTLVVNDYWNGTQMVPVPTNNNTTVQGIFVSSKAGIVVCAPEKYYADFDSAKLDYVNCKFTSPLPAEGFVQKGWVIAKKSTTNLANLADALVLPYNGGGGSSGIAVSDSTKEDTVNKIDDYEGNKASSVKFLSVKGIERFWDYVKTQANTFTGKITIDAILNLNKLKSNPLGYSFIIGTTGSGPRDLVVDSAGNVYATSQNPNSVSKITPSGVSSNFGTTGSGEYGIAIDSAGNIYTANSSSNNVSKITPAGVSTILGTTGTTPIKIAIDSIGNIYTCNSGSNNVSKITPAGVSTIFANTGTNPYGIVIDSIGNIYTCNYGSNNVSKITPAGVSTILGTTGTNPIGIAIDSAGNIFTTNYTANNVSKITPAGVSSNFGIAGGINPNGIAIDSAGNIYTANSSSNNVSIITPAGVSTIFANTSTNNSGIVIDSIGNIYTCSGSSNTVSKITPQTPYLTTDINGNVLLSTLPILLPASDTETQITATVIEDNRVVSRLKLFNWWTWIKTQAQTISGAWTISGLWTFSNKVTLATGTTTVPPLLIPNATALTTTPVNGAIERDSSGVLWETHGGVRYQVAKIVDVNSRVPIGIKMMGQVSYGPANSGTKFGSGNNTYYKTFTLTGVVPGDRIIITQDYSDFQDIWSDNYVVNARITTNDTLFIRISSVDANASGAVYSSSDPNIRLNYIVF
jgi:streptogramin lyase